MSAIASSIRTVAVFVVALAVSSGWVWGAQPTITIVVVMTRSQGYVACGLAGTGADDPPDAYPNLSARSPKPSTL
jgi:hypothetical protein